LEDIAKAAHEVIRLIAEMHNEPPLPSWEDATEEVRRATLDGVEYIKSRPDCNKSMLHDNWCARKIEDGWTFGETKDAAAKTHPCLVPFDELPSFQQEKDIVFLLTVKAALAEKNSR